MTHAILIWGFPFYLILVEIFFRSVSQLDTTGFIGPAIATSGLSFLMPLTKPKEGTPLLTSSTIQTLKRHGLEAVPRSDQRFVPVVWATILAGFLVWLWSCSVSLTSPDARIWFVQKHVAIGMINYLAAAICAAIKVNL